VRGGQEVGRRERKSEDRGSISSNNCRSPGDTGRGEVNEQDRRRPLDRGKKFSPKLHYAGQEGGRSLPHEGGRKGISPLVLGREGFVSYHSLGRQHQKNHELV